jgi:hypothetical protein
MRELLSSKKLLLSILAVLFAAATILYGALWIYVDC